MRRFIWIPVMLLMVTLGCGMLLGSSKRGREIDQTKLAQVEKGKTTMAEVEALLGKPQAKTTSAEGTVWTYESLKTSAFGKASSESVEIVFGGDGVVKDIKKSSWEY